MVYEVDAGDLVDSVDPVYQELPDLSILLFQMGTHESYEVLEIESVNGIGEILAQGRFQGIIQ